MEVETARCSSSIEEVKMQEALIFCRSVMRAVAPADTFIAADDFQSPEELAHFLVELSKDKKRYLRYECVDKLRSDILIGRNTMPKRQPMCIRQQCADCAEICINLSFESVECMMTGKLGGTHVHSVSETTRQHCWKMPPKLLQKVLRIREIKSWNFLSKVEICFAKEKTLLTWCHLLRRKMHQSFSVFYNFLPIG